jgi:hypothetical protein
MACCLAVTRLGANGHSIPGRGAEVYLGETDRILEMMITHMPLVQSLTKSDAAYAYGVLRGFWPF